MRAILDQIDGSLGAGRRIYLHCWGGIGRTGTTVGCYLVRHGRAPEDALHQIATWRTEQLGSRVYARSPETSEQVDFVKSWSESAGIQQ